MTIHDDTLDVDVQTVDITSSEDPENNMMELLAKMAAQTLCRHYPAHLWAVGWAPGMALVVKNMAIEDGRYGFTVDAAKAATISEIEHAVMLGGGELLERCGESRGKWNGEFLKLKDIQ